MGEDAGGVPGGGASGDGEIVVGGLAAFAADGGEFLFEGVAEFEAARGAGW